MNMKQKGLQIQQMEEMLDVLDSYGYSSESVKKYSSAISRFISYISTNELDAVGDSVERFIEYSCSIRKHNNPQYFISHMRGALLAFIFFWKMVTYVLADHLTNQNFQEV